MDTALLWRAWGVLALALVLTATLTRAEPKVALVYGGHITVTSDGNHFERTDAHRQCREKGGLLVADHSRLMAVQFTEELGKAVPNGFCRWDASRYSPMCYGAHSAGWADTSPGCIVIPRETLGSLEETVDLNQLCPYRWSEGWFSRYNDGNAVGVTFYNRVWADLFPQVVTKWSNLGAYELFTDDTSADNIYRSGPVNGYTHGVMWNASPQCTGGSAACIAPHGNPYIALGAREMARPDLDVHGVRVDVPSSSASPFALSRYVLTCQWQGVEASFYAGIQQPTQNPFVPGWKSLTWAQSHWWVIFLIIALLVLAAAVAGLVWWWCKQVSKKRGVDQYCQGAEAYIYTNDGPPNTTELDHIPSQQDDISLHSSLSPDTSREHTNDMSFTGSNPLTAPERAQGNGRASPVPNVEEGRYLVDKDRASMDTYFELFVNNSELRNSWEQPPP